MEGANRKTANQTVLTAATPVVNVADLGAASPS
jgi:hypothetical protein